jgi:hypothetical protein
MFNDTCRGFSGNLTDNVWRTVTFYPSGQFVIRHVLTLNMVLVDDTPYYLGECNDAVNVDLEWTGTYSINGVSNCGGTCDVRKYHRS